MQSRRIVVIGVAVLWLGAFILSEISPPAPAAPTRNAVKARHRDVSQRASFPFHNTDLCYPVRDALMKYRVDVVEPYLYTGVAPNGSRPLTYRVLASERSGFGSNAKGMSTMLLIAMVLRKPLILETDCPQMARFYRSDVVIIQPVVPLSTPKARQKCEHWIPWMENRSYYDTTNVAHLEDVVLGGADVDHAVYCDRHLLHLLPQFKSVQQVVGAALGSMKARDLSGCLFDAAFELISPTKELTEDALQPYTAAYAAAVSRGAPPPHFITMQIRLGGKKVAWEDPARVGDHDVTPYLACLVNMTKHLATILLARERKDPTRAPSFFFFASADGEAGYKAVIDAIPVDRRIEFMPSHFAHSARSYRLDSDVVKLNDEKVVGDFDLLSRGTIHLFSRSAFGEMPAWIASTRRNSFPAVPRRAKQLLREYGSNSSLLIGCYRHVTDCSRQSC